MISPETVKEMCGDISTVFEKTLDEGTPEDILASNEFNKIKMKVLKDEPTMTDERLLRLILEGYSERLRKV